MGLVNSNKSKLVKTVLLSCAGLSLIVALSIVFTNNNRIHQEQSSYLVKTNENGLLKSSPNGVGSGLLKENDLTIVGHGSLKAAAEDGEQELVREEEENRENPVIRISHQGRVRGTVLKSREGRDYFAFYQVPYARPPVGKLRFALPEKPRRWSGIRDGTKPGPQCIQRDKYTTKPNSTAGSEDCLQLNIYTPKLPESRRNNPNLPVLVYLHGGGAGGNGTRYGAKYFMDEDVILITVEYRLGVFGMFTTGTREFPGNLDSRDQIQALKWIQENIHKFGGDPKKVLIFGNSSGSASVHAHLISPMSKGLFSRAIMQSGNCIRNDQLIPKPQEKIENFTKEVGCEDSNANQNQTLRETMKCLRNLDANIIALSRLAGTQGFIEELHDDRENRKFFSSTPWSLVESGKIGSPEVPVIVGINSRELFSQPVFNGLLMNENATQFLDGVFEEVLGSLIKIKDDEEYTAGKKFREVYFGSEEISYDTRTHLWDLFSDATAHAARVAGLTLANATGQPVYFYWLDKEPEKSYGQAAKDVFPPPYGVSHADELQFLFPYYGYPEITMNSSWFQFSKNLIKIWTSFARDGKPEITNIPGNAQKVGWKPILLEDNGMEWLQLDDEIKYVRPFTERMKLWDEYIDDLYINYDQVQVSPEFAKVMQYLISTFFV